MNNSRAMVVRRPLPCMASVLYAFWLQARTSIPRWRCTERACYIARPLELLMSTARTSGVYRKCWALFTLMVTNPMIQIRRIFFFKKQNCTKKWVLATSGATFRKPSSQNCLKNPSDWNNTSTFFGQKLLISN